MLRKPVIGVVGTGSVDTGPAVTHAWELGKLIAREGWAVVSGGRNAGVMKAVTAGAKQQGGLTIGILPKAYPEEKIAPGLDVVIVTDLNNARNNVIGLSCNVLVACGIDGPGTASEVALALKNEKTVILLDVTPEALAFFRTLEKERILTARTPAEVVQQIKQHRLVRFVEPQRNQLGQPIGSALPQWQPPPRPVRQPLEGRYCRLEPLELDRHAAELFEADAADKDGRTWTYLAYGPFPDLPSYRAHLESRCLGDDPFFFAIRDLSDNKAVGGASYLRIMPEAGSIEVGHIHYSPRLQQQPAATEAMFLMMQWAFANGYRRYEWKCDALNAASRAAAQRLGLSFEGIFRQATVYKGRNRDTAWYAAIDAEWPALKKAFETWLAPGNFDGKGQQRQRLSELTRPIVKQLG
jgi:uncharacterized protein (TIGR00725 family)